MAKTAKLTLTEYAAIEARGARVYWHRASIERVGDVYKMSGPSGVHTLHRHSTGLDRLNTHWVAFANHTANLYPKG